MWKRFDDENQKTFPQRVVLFIFFHPMIRIPESALSELKLLLGTRQDR